MSDTCGCPDDRCVGYHHEADAPCTCVAAVDLDTYTRANWSALYVLEDRGNDPFNGVNRSTIRALSRRGLVVDKGDGRAILTPTGSAALTSINAERVVGGPNASASSRR